jgi:hypothetical protein
MSNASCAAVIMCWQVFGPLELPIHAARMHAALPQVTLLRVYVNPLF